MNTAQSMKDRTQVATDAMDFQPDYVQLQAKPVPLRARWVLYSLLAFLLAIIVWASVAEVDRVVSVSGKLVTEDPQFVLRPYAKGTVQKVHVRAGQKVKAGDVLVTLDSTFTQSDLQRMRGRLDQSRGRYQRLLSELNETEFDASAGDDQSVWSVQQSILERRKSLHASRLAAADESIAEAEAAVATNKIQRDALVEQIALQADLVLEAATTSEKLELERNLLIAENEFRRLTATADELSSRVRAAIAGRESYLEARQESIVSEISEVASEVDQLEEEYAKSVRLAETVVLRCPENLDSATVLEVHDIQVGGFVQELQPLVTLVPLGKPLVAEVMVPAGEIARVAEDQQARIKLEAFPFQKHGSLRAKVAKVSADAFQTADTNMAMYRCDIQLESQLSSLAGVPEGFQLLPGMRLTAEMKVGKRRVITYFLYPIIRALDESIREP